MHALYTAILLLLAWVSNAKTIRGRFQLEAGDFDHGPEYEISKYSFAVGLSKVEGKFKYKDPRTWQTSPALYLFMDTAWDAYHSKPACEDKVRLAETSIPIGELTDSHMRQGHLSQTAKANFSNVKRLDDGFIEWEFSWTISHTTRTHGWFIIAADCALEQYNAHVPAMEFEIKLFNPGNTHLPADEHGLPKIYLLTFLGMSIYLAYLLTLLKSHFDETRRVHLVVRLLLGAYVAQLVSFFCELVHLEFYKYDGEGMWFVDFLSEVLEGLSQTLISFVLICLASGWTLVETESDKNRPNSVSTLLTNPMSLVKGPNAAIFGLLILVGISLWLQVANKGMDGDFSKFHDFESTPGRILVAIRLFLGVTFISSLHFTIRTQNGRGGDRLIGFLKQLMLLGGIWFLSFPLVVFIAGLLVHYVRHRFVVTGTLVLQTSSLAFLGNQFMSNHSTYFKISTLSDSGVLPGAGGLVRAPKISRD